MKRIKVLTTIIAVIMVITTYQSASAQHKMQGTFTSDEGGEFMIIQGINALIMGDSNSIRVEMIPPKNGRKKEYKEVDMKAKDLVIMCNGKKLKSVAQLEEMIEKLEIGDDIKLGIKRGKKMFIVSFPKADPKAGGQMMMQMTIDDGGGEGGEMNSLNINGKTYNNASIFHEGIIFASEDNKLVVLAIMPQLKDLVKGDLPQEGDLIVSLNGNVETSNTAMMNLYDEIKIGEKIEIVLTRDGKKYTINFIKEPLPSGAIIIKD